MVAQTASLPNLREMFIPDPGHILVDADLSGADAQVVAWEAEDEDLKAAFRAGLKVHLKNARDIFPEKVRGWSDEAIQATNGPGGIYYQCKRGVHATNYVAMPRTVGMACGWTTHEAELFQRTWFGLHPGIRDWHRRVERQLATTRTVANAFGFRRVYFDRVDGLLAEAVAWIPQSTVAIVTNKAALELYNTVDWVQLLMQVHDSLVFQIAKDKYTNYNSHLTKQFLQSKMTVPVPYADPLVIPWGMKSSDKSWADCK